MRVRLIDLPEMHPCLLWDDITIATAVVLRNQQDRLAQSVEMNAVGIPDFGTESMTLEIDARGISDEDLVKVQRTYEPHRLIELAAISIGGLALFAAGGHQIRDVALRGSSADYLVDSAGHLLEIAGRSRRADFHQAWQVRWDRLAQRQEWSFYVCVVEFESPSGRLEFGGDFERHEQ